MKVRELITWLSKLPPEANIYTEELSLSQPHIIFHHALVVMSREGWEVEHGALIVRKDGSICDLTKQQPSG